MKTLPVPDPLPTLSQYSVDPAARRRALAEARALYEYDYSYGGLCFTQDLPLDEAFSPAYIARASEVLARIEANRWASRIDEKAHAFGHAIVSLMGHRESSDLYAVWERMFSHLPRPLALTSWQSDWAFAWQRLTGPAPIVLRRIERLPPCLPVTDDDLTAACPAARSLSRALSRGRLFIADYPLFEGVATGVTEGRAKFLCAPVALFVADPTVVGGLAPVAIQCGGARAGRESLYRPRDPDWGLARFMVQVADENLQGVLAHMGYCHEVIQRFTLAMHRQLSSAHPLYALLEPHTEFTLAVNQVARRSVVNPGGVQDRLLAPTIEAQMSLLVEGVRALDLGALDPTVDFARRGVDDREALPIYPFRDDGLPLWEATNELVRDYVALYYERDEQVAADVELAAFVREIGAEDGGRLPRMLSTFDVTTRESLVALLSRVIYRATTYHAAINNGNYDWASFAPNMATAAFAGLPPRGMDAEAYLRAMLPPPELALEAIAATWQVHELALNRLGAYRPGHFLDPRVSPILERFSRALGAIEARTRDANRTRPLPYELLLPSRITASINA
jgi:arachidonate 15-lipoxygenase